MMKLRFVSCWDIETKFWATYVLNFDFRSNKVSFDKRLDCRK